MTESVQDSIETVRQQAFEAAAAAPEFAALESARVVRALAGATATLCEPSSSVGQRARQCLPESTGLSHEMVDWALSTERCTVTVTKLERMLEELTGAHPRALLSRPRLHVVVLAGNVFVAALKGILLPLLAQVPVVAKTSSREVAFPHLLKAALTVEDPLVARFLELVSFPGGSTDREDALFAQADVVSVYGSDTTLGDIRARLSPTTTFVGHGHGIGAAYVPAGAAQTPEAARQIACGLAMDVAAYDQRGCMSPHAIWVAPDAGIAGRDLAHLVAGELAALASSLPRGPLPVEVGAAQVQWRGVSAARGELFEGDGYAVSFEGDSALRISPGWRNVAVLECAGEPDLGQRLLPLGTHLKAVGVAGDEAARRRVAAGLPAPLAPRICPCGHMQRPPFESLADGWSPWHGALRWIQVD